VPGALPVCLGGAQGEGGLGGLITLGECVSQFERGAVPTTCVWLELAGVQELTFTANARHDPIPLSLQGGYHLQSLGEAVAESFRGLLGLPAASDPVNALVARRLLQEEPLRKVEIVVGEVRRRHGLV